MKMCGVRCALHWSQLILNVAGHMPSREKSKQMIDGMDVQWLLNVTLHARSSHENMNTTKKLK